MEPLTQKTIDVMKVADTGSMRPLNDNGGWAVIGAWPWEWLEPEMVVLWEDKETGMLIAHQIVQVSKWKVCPPGAKERNPDRWRLVTKGVANPTKDKGWVTRREYMGVVIGNPYGGYYPYANEVLSYNHEGRYAGHEWHPLNNQFFPTLTPKYQTA